MIFLPTHPWRWGAWCGDEGSTGGVLPDLKYPHLPSLASNSASYELVPWGRMNSGRIDKGEFMTSTPKKCANAVCSCLAPENEKYCSAYCEGVGDKVEIACKCDHPECRGDVS